MLEAIREALWEEMERDPDVFLMGEDIGAYGGAFKVTDGFLDAFGDQRVVDTPISEAGFTGAAAGAAHMGLRPVVEMQFMDFVSCAYEPLTNYIATSRWRQAGAQPIVIRGPVGGGVRGGPFHSQNPEMAFFHTPGLKIVYPSTARDAKGLLKAAIRDDDPVLYFEHKKLYRAPFLREVLPPRITWSRWARLAWSGRARMCPSSRTEAWSTRAEGGGTAGGGRDRRGDPGPPVPHAAGRGGGPGQCSQDAPAPGGSRGHPDGRDCGRDRHAGERKGVRMAGRAHAAGHGSRHACAVLSSTRGLFPASGR
jgi:hypothetical protein